MYKKIKLYLKLGLRHLKFFIRSLCKPQVDLTETKDDFGTCPNCGESWKGKKSGSLSLKKTASNLQTKAGAVPTRKVSICQDCLAIPEQLDVELITTDLNNCGWPKQETALVKPAVDDLKRKQPVIG